MDKQEKIFKTCMDLMPDMADMSTTNLVAHGMAIIQELITRDCVEIFLGLSGKNCVQAKVLSTNPNGLMLQINGKIFHPDNGFEIKQEDDFGVW